MCLRLQFGLADARSPDERTAPAQDLALAGAAALAVGATAHAQTAEDFVSTVGAPDKFEIAAAKVAQAKSHDPASRKFAAEMIKDHTTSTAKVKTAAHKVMGHNPPPPMLTPNQNQMLSRLRATKGPDFDRTYVDQQLQAHQQAPQLMQGYAQTGEAPPLKQAAREIAPVVQMHLDMLKAMPSHGI